jgi:energy-coupling factor transport system ATP-binding protein
MQLVMQGVGYHYSSAPVGQYALQGIDLKISEGDFWGIIGHSGSGKSTLIQIASALVQPTMGQVLLDGLDLAVPKHRHRLFRRIGVVFQYPEAQLFATTVFDDIAYAARNAGFSPELVEEKVAYWMQAFGLNFDQYAFRSPFELSGGEQRRVALAGIMVVEPELLILDEPTAGLDPAGRHQLLDVILNYHHQGASIVMVSHSMEDIAQVTNRILVLKDGEPYLQGTPAEVFNRTADLVATDLGVPVTESFAAELRQSGLALPTSLLNVESLADAIIAALPKRNFRVDHGR